MTSQTLSEILSDHAKAERTGNTITIPTGLDVTIFAAVGDESLTIHQVVSVELKQEAAIIDTKRGEHYALVYADIRLLKYSETSRRSGAGYAAMSR